MLHAFCTGKHDIGRDSGRSLSDASSSPSDSIEGPFSAYFQFIAKARAKFLEPVSQSAEEHGTPSEIFLPSRMHD